VTIMDGRISFTRTFRLTTYPNHPRHGRSSECHRPNCRMIVSTVARQRRLAEKVSVGHALLTTSRRSHRTATSSNSM
jgi:hypothetical protein